MNKYLFKKIEQAHGAFFEDLILIANEICKESQSETFEEFTELEPKRICKVLGWNQKKETIKLIEDSIKDKEFITNIFHYGHTGFIAKCHLPHHSDFRFKEGESEPWASSVHSGICRVDWVYAESIGELVDKLEKLAEDFYVESYKKEQTSVSTAN